MTASMTSPDTTLNSNPNVTVFLKFPEEAFTVVRFIEMAPFHAAVATARLEGSLEVAAVSDFCLDTLAGV